MGGKNAVITHDDAAAFLPPVLQGVEPVIRKSRKVGTLGAVHTEHAAFFMYFCHGVPLSEKDKAPTRGREYPCPDERLYSLKSIITQKVLFYNGQYRQLFTLKGGRKLSIPA